MDNRPIGVFDSGLGGLTTVRQLLEELPHEDIIYFGDTGRVPYGTRSAETIAKYAAEDCRFLQRHHVKMIIAACGTASSVAGSVLSALPLPAMGVINAAAVKAATVTKNNRIGIIGTAATVRTDAFGKIIRAKNPDAQVFSQACSLFVPLVESGWIDPQDPVATAVAARYLQPLKEQGIDTLIMGCTHFPLLAPILSEVLERRVTLIDSGREAAESARDLLTARDMLHDQSGSGDCHFFVSDRPQGFSEVAAMFLGKEVQGDVETIDLSLLTD